MSVASLPESSALLRLQRQFADRIRDPQRQPLPPGVELRRMAVYEGLFFRNIESFLSGGFPVFRSLFEPGAWDDLVREFMRDHRCTSPYFLRISEEFIAFLQRRGVREGEPPFLLELAHYEWVELALDVADAEPDWSRIDPNGDLLAAAPVVSPLAWPLVYRYPVHRIGPDFRPGHAPDQPTCLVVYRDRVDKVRFIVSNPVTVDLLSRLVFDEPSQAKTGRQGLLELARDLEHPDPQALLAAGEAILRQLQRQGVILGTLVA